MTFKKRAAEDLTRVFLNGKEHAEEIEFMGRQIMAVVDHEGDDMLDQEDDRLGVAIEMVSLYIDVADCPAVLHPTMSVSFEGATWHVHSSFPELGMMTIRLYREIRA